jgi:hypothetical protein
VGDGSAAAVRARLCVRPAAPAPDPSPAGIAPTQPPAVLDAEQHLQEYRELTYLEPVPVRPVTEEELRTRIDAAFDRRYPRGLMSRRSTSWSTIGVVPPGTDLRAAFRADLPAPSGVAYDLDTNVLSLVTSDRPGPVERFSLLHQLALALDDQRFELARIEPRFDGCLDDQAMAALGAVEGSAGFFARQVALRTFSATDQRALEPARLYRRPSGVPPFVHAIRAWPDVEGPRFAGTITDMGETEGINEPLSSLPVSTEQVLHARDRLRDPPLPVDVPDLGPALGAGWSDLDVMDAGEAWLLAMLALRLPAGDAATAATGWGGGQYRAWADGAHTAVLLQTVWDTPRDATEFLTAARRWIGRTSTATAGTAGDPATVVALFASDPATLTALRAALG